MGAPIAGSGRIESSDPFAGGGGPVGLRDCPAHRRLTPETLVPFDALALGGLSQARWRLARRSRVTLRSTKSLIRVLRQLVGEQRQRDTDQQRCDHRGDHRAPEIGPSFTVDLLPRDLGATWAVRVMESRSWSRPWLSSSTVVMGIRHLHHLEPPDADLQVSNRGLGLTSQLR